MLKPGVETPAEHCNPGIDRRRVAIARAQTTLGALALLKGVVHMPRQDKEAFDQRGNQHRDHCHWNIAGDRSQPPGQEVEHTEGKDGGHRRREHRTDHPPCGNNRGLSRLIALLVQKIGVFAHHNGIVDNDPERQDQRKQGEHIDRQPQRPHHAQRRGNRNRNANGNPKGRSHVEKQEQEGKHDQHAVKCIVPQQKHPAKDEVRAHVIVFYGDIGGQCGFNLSEIVADHSLLADRIALGSAPYLQRDGRFTLIVDCAAGVGDGFDHLRNVPYPDHGAIWLRTDLRLPHAVCTGIGAKRPNGTLPPERSGGQVTGSASDGRRDISRR